MSILATKKIAIVADWIFDWGGAELVLSHFMEFFPEADIYTSVFFQNDNPIFEGRNVYSSFIQKIPILNKKHKFVPHLRPRAFESFDLSGYDIVISLSSAESKGVITKPDCLHICYCHTPTRYYWSHYHEYLDMLEYGLLNPIIKLIMPRMIHSLRQWDYVASQRPDYYIANSFNTASRIKKYYNRESEVIYPATDIGDYEYMRDNEKEDYYVYVGRVIPYKKFDLVVDAFNKNGKKIILITNTPNKLYKKLKSISKSNIEWKLNISRQETLEIVSKSRGMLFPPDEDFGLVPVEAMSMGVPVIAYKSGGATETVIDGISGVFFEEQSVDSLNSSLDRFEKMEFDRQNIINIGAKFSLENFRRRVYNFIESKLTDKGI